MIEKLAGSFNAGGSFMWVILVILAIAAAIIIERLIFYYIICRGNSSKHLNNIIKSLENENFDEARTITSRIKSPLNILLLSAIERFSIGNNIKEIEDGLQETAINEMPKMIQRLNYLSLFANIATLTGLIGTISGLQSSFSSLVAVEASKKATMLAAGIAEAMNTTAFGLIVAVPCMIMYTVLYNKQQHLTKDIDQSVLRLINYMKKKKD